MNRPTADPDPTQPQAADADSTESAEPAEPTEPAEPVDSTEAAQLPDSGSDDRAAASTSENPGGEDKSVDSLFGLLGAGHGNAAEHTTSRHRGRRVLRRVLAWLTVVALLVVTAIIVIGWRVSDEITQASAQPGWNNVATPQGSTRIRLQRNENTEKPGVYGIAWRGGYGQVSTVVAMDATSVVREFRPVVGGLTEPTYVDFDNHAYVGDPTTALGLNFSTVSIPSEVGDLPAWQILPPDKKLTGTWIIFVHGHHSSRAESLRYLTMWHRAGYPVLVPMYRNDLGAPASPDHVNKLGVTEWKDISSAIAWARTAGAKDVVLAGWSMGGAMSLQTMLHSTDRDFIRGMILDSPVLNWEKVLHDQARQRGIPTPLGKVGVAMARARFDMDLRDFTWSTKADKITKPLLVFASDGDKTVNSGPAQQLAKRRPDLVRLVNMPQAAHCSSWNVAARAYERQMLAWLAEVAPAR